MQDMFHGPLEDRILIRERYGAYSDAVFQRDQDAWLACWKEDGTWELFDQEISGKEALGKQWSELWSALDRMSFFSEIGSIEVQGGWARVRSYCHEIVALRSGDLLKVVAQYHDELSKENDEWLFARRRYTLHIRE
jgi:ketosteroid isomerase-like protein